MHNIGNGYWNYFKQFCLCLLLSLTISCVQKIDDPGDYTKAFKPILAKANKILDKHPDSGLHYLDSAFKTLTNPSIPDRVRYYSLHFVIEKRVRHNFVKASLYADSMMSTTKEGSNKPKYAALTAEAFFAKGDACFELQLFSNAYQNYYDGYLIGKSHLNNEVLSDYTYRMGMIMYKQRNYKLATNYFKESYKQSLSVPNDFPGFYRKQEVLDNIGISYRRDNKIDSALAYFDKAIELINSYEGKFGDKNVLLTVARGVVYGNKAEIYIPRKLYAEAAGLLRQSISINLTKGNDNVDAEFSEIKLGEIYLQRSQHDSLEGLLGNLRKQLDSVRNPEAEADWHRLSANYFLWKKDLPKALDHIQQYNKSKDSLSENSRLILKSDVYQQLANYQKQQEIDILSNNNKLQLIFLYAIAIAAILIATIMFLVYRNWTRSKKDVLTVNILNQQINEQNHVLENALNELNNSSQEKDRILRAVAHDLRNPIGGIASLTSMMADDDYTDEQKELINLLKETSVNSLELINEILEATNLSSVKLNLEQVEINLLVNNSVELLRFKAAEKKQPIYLETLAEPTNLLISREKIWRVISNLISNAIKFSPSGAPINVKVEKGEHQITISVKDSGIGIPDKMKDQVFNLFTIAQRPGTAGEKSFGLGLSICRQIIEKHQGKIWFEGNETGGSTFFVTLPAANQ
ncbi:hypothetical protein A0256_15815 [Mucilaginibacter sp. PAMC 26640]|nr:hypothetical protein A0256_15815 [Mucilaginibacter sp. PAMC 26640]